MVAYWQVHEPYHATAWLPWRREVNCPLAIMPILVLLRHGSHEGRPESLEEGHGGLQGARVCAQGGRPTDRRFGGAREARSEGFRFNKGTMIGMGIHLQTQDGVAFLALHEGRTWIHHVFENAPGGGIDDLNQIHDHALYKKASRQHDQSLLHSQPPH